jgi:translation initiation factor 3 subunit L
LPEITVAYESGWNKYTEKYYSRTEWPEAELIAPLVNDGTPHLFFFFLKHNNSRITLLDQIFLILYRELYYRHVYSRLQPNIDDRFHSYENSCELFNYLLSVFRHSMGFFKTDFFLDSDGPVELELPEQWLWDIIDEFIYQYQVFCTWRSKVSTKTQEELAMLAEGVPVSDSFFFLIPLQLFIGVEFVQRFERAVFFDAKI